MLKFVKLSVFLGLFAFVFVFTANVMAMEDAENTTTDEEVSVTNTNSNKSDRGVQAQEKKDAMMAAKEERKNALSEARLKVCESRQERIQNRLTNLMTLGASSIDNFNTFYVRVDSYYNDKLASEYPLDNYDEMKGEISGNKAEVIAALADAKANGQEFSCDSDDPKGQTDAFRASIKELIEARKDYKASVREFVAAVRDLAKEARSARLSVTPEATTSTTSAGVDTEGVGE